MNVNTWISNGGFDNQEIQPWLARITQLLWCSQLLLPTFWHCLHCFDPLLSFLSSSRLKEVVSLIWGDDLKEVAVNVVFFGWNQKRGWKQRLDEKPLMVNSKYMYISWSQLVSEEATWGICFLWQQSYSPSGTNSTAVTTDPRRWMEPSGSSPWHKGDKRRQELGLRKIIWGN